MKNSIQFIRSNTLFGVCMGGSFIITSLLFWMSGKNIVLDPRVNNIISTLSIVGVFIGIRQFRDKQQNGYISYGKALLSGGYMLIIAAALYAAYTYVIYSVQPELTSQFKRIMQTLIQQAYGETTLYDTINTSMQAYYQPIMIAIGEFINKILMGMFFALFLAAILRRKKRNNFM